MLARKLIPLVLLSVAGIVIAAGYGIYRSSYSGVSTKEINKASDLSEYLDLSSAGAVKDRNYKLVCLTHGYGFVLKQVQEILAARGIAFESKSLAAAGGINDVFEGEFDGSVTLLSADKALILRIDKRKGISVGQRSCQNSTSVKIHLRTYAQHIEIGPD